MTVFYPHFRQGDAVGSSKETERFFVQNWGSVGGRAGIAAINDSYVVTIVGIIAVVIHVAIVM